MRNDYLMDKSGVDDEIKELEDLLSVFRHDGETVLHVPNNHPAHERSWRWIFSYSFASAAAAAAIIVAALIYTQNLSRGNEAAVQLAAHSGTASADSDFSRTVLEPEGPVGQVVHASTQGRKPRQKPKSKAPPLKRTRVVKKPGPASLTDEERHAYEQLKLALAITSSKLQIVKDSINGIEEHSSAPSDSRR